MHFPGHGYGLVNTDTTTIPESDRVDLRVKILSSVERGSIVLLEISLWYVLISRSDVSNRVLFVLQCCRCNLLKRSGVRLSVLFASTIRFSMRDFMNRKYAEELLIKTSADYNKIARKFSSTRKYLSADLWDLKKYAEAGDCVLDLGCGNGRLTELFKDMNVCYIGGDSSSKLVEIAREKYPQKNFVILDPIKLDFPPERFDKVFCLSVFHHIPSVEFRLAYLSEIYNVLKSGGYLILSVWNLWNRSGTFWQIIKNGIFHPKLDLNDIFFPFRDNSGKILANRYIHCFKKNELEKLLLESGFEIDVIEVQKRGLRRVNENILVVARK